MPVGVGPGRVGAEGGGWQRSRKRKGLGLTLTGPRSGSGASADPCQLDLAATATPRQINRALTTVQDCHGVALSPSSWLHPRMGIFGDSLTLNFFADTEQGLCRPSALCVPPASASSSPSSPPLSTTAPRQPKQLSRLGACWKPGSARNLEGPMKTTRPRPR